MSETEPGIAAPRHSNAPKVLRVLLVVLGIAGVLTLLWYLVLRKEPLPEGVLFVSGRIEGDEAAVAAKVSGKLLEISVREGDTVSAGQVIATLDDDIVRAREEQARAGVDQATARLAQARQQIAVLEQQLLQSELGIEQARIDAQGRVAQERARVAAAEASLAQTQAAYEQARYDAERFGELAREGIEPERRAVQTRTVAEAQAAAVRAAQKQVDAAVAALETATANLANPKIRTAQAGAVREQIVQARAQVSAAEADLDRSRAQLEEARAARADLIVTAPFDGTVTTRAAEPGEVLAAGAPIVTIVDLSRVYLRGFIPEGDIGRVRVDQPARVYLDSAPETPIDAVVSRVDPEAAFTPENTYFREDRVKQVVGVKLQLRGATGFAKPGMPADGQILVDGETWPEAATR